MPQLSSRRFSERPEYTVVLGPCPGCDDWQVDYTDEVRDSYSRPTIENPTTFTVGDFHQVIEDVLQEHLNECPHLRDLVEG